MPSSRSVCAGLDDAVGVEHQRVAGAESAAGDVQLGSRHDAERRAPGAVDGPRPARGVTTRARAGGPRWSAGSRRSRGRAGRAPRSRRSRRSAGAAGSRWPRGTARCGGSAPIRPPRAPPNCSAFEAAPTPLPQTSTRISSKRRPLVVEVGDQEVAAVPHAARGEHGRLRAPALGQLGNRALGLQPVTEVGQHRLAHRPGQAALLAAGGVEDQGHRDHQDHAGGDPRGVHRRVEQHGRQGGGAGHGGEDHQRPEPEQQHAEQQPDVVRRHRHQRVGQRPRPRSRARRRPAARRGSWPGSGGSRCARSRSGRRRSGAARSASDEPRSAHDPRPHPPSSCLMGQSARLTARARRCGRRR